MVTMAMRPTKAAIAAGDYVENAALRLEVLRLVDLGILTWTDLADELGVCDTALMASLGHGARGGRYVRYERACEVARAIGLDPVDVGL